LAAATKRQRDARVAARRLDDGRVLLSTPRFSASSIIDMPMRSFTLRAD